MDFTFSAEQEELRRTVRSWVGRPESAAWAREMIDDPRGFTDAWWAEIGDLGLTGVLLPEELPGTGSATVAPGGDGTAGLLDAVVIQEELGRAALPGPYLSSAVAATLAAVRIGDGDLLRRLAAGERGTLALEEAGNGDPLDSIATVADPEGSGGWRLTGLKQLVLDGNTADFAVVAARAPEGLATFVVEQPAGDPVPTLDVTRKAARLSLEGRRARRLGPIGDQRHLLARVRDDVAIALCAETVGAAERAVGMATEYAKQRVQFDRPIASFQAIRHKIVDMLHQLELARVGTHWAAWCSQVDDPQREHAVAAAKSFTAEAAVMVTGENIQVHGGVGFTWDLDCHLLFRRVKQNDVLFGHQSWQRRRLADLVLGPVPVPSGPGR